MTEQWLEEKSRLSAKAELVRSNEELQMIDKDAVDYLFGLFGESHIRFGDQRVPEEDPTITEMTTKAIEVQWHYSITHIPFNLFSFDAFLTG